MSYDTVFLGTAPFGFPVMRALKDREDVNIKGVFTQPDRERGRGQETQSPPVGEFAPDLDLPLYQPPSINEEGYDQLREIGSIDLAFVVAYGQFLDPDVFNYPEVGTFNFHASLLPRWRGAAPIRHTLLAGDEETGVTLFRLEEDMDTGPVCEQVRTRVEENETYGELYERLSELNVGVLNVFMENLKQDRLDCRPQEGEPTYAPMIDNDDARIDWTQSAREIDRHVRTFCPDPGAFTTLNDERVKLYRVSTRESGGTSEPGRVRSVGDDDFVVEAGEGLVSIEELQPAGSRRMDVEDYLAGQPDVDENSRFSGAKTAE
jgi:methionyl-tRNA formyltransferase